MSKHWDQVQWTTISEKKFKPYEAGLYNQIDKAMHHLGWKAVWNFECTVQETIDWYRTFYEEPESIQAFTHAQILRYEKDEETWFRVGSMSILKQIEVKPQQQISNAGGDVWHALKSTEDSFIGFGEAYFSWVDPGSIKAWKKHLDMTINLIVPIGMVRFIF